MSLINIFSTQYKQFENKVYTLHLCKVKVISWSQISVKDQGRKNIQMQENQGEFLFERV